MYGGGVVLNLNLIPGTLNFCERLKKYDTVFKGVGGVNGEIMLHNIKTQIKCKCKWRNNATQY